MVLLLSSHEKREPGKAGWKCRPWLGWVLSQLKLQPSGLALEKRGSETYDGHQLWQSFVGLFGSLCLCLCPPPPGSDLLALKPELPTEIAPASPPPPLPPPPFCQLVKLAHDFGFLERGHTETAYWRGGAAAFWAPPHWSAQSRAAPFNTTTSTSTSTTTTTTRTVTHTKRRGVDTQEPHWTSPSPACCSPRCIQIGPGPRLLPGVHTWKN